MDNKSRELKPTQVLLFVGYEYHLDSALVKPTREMAQTSGFDPTLKVKTCFECKMFDVANWVARPTLYFLQERTYLRPNTLSS